MLLVATEPTYRIISQENARVGLWMQRCGAGEYRDGAICIGLERHGELVAGTSYDHFNGSSIFANIAIRGPITRAWLYAIFHYPFVHCGASVLIGLIADDNPKSHHLVARFGFTKKLSLPDADINLYAMNRHECRFLRSPYV